jgi:hypothetical protein
MWFTGGGSTGVFPPVMEIGSYHKGYWHVRNTWCWMGMKLEHHPKGGEMLRAIPYEPLYWMPCPPPPDDDAAKQAGDTR